MAENKYDILGLDQTTYDEAEVQTVSEGFKPFESGVYKSTVKEIAIFTSSKGAGMLKIVINPDDDLENITVYQNTKKKNGEPNPIGQATLKHVLEACNLTVEDSVIKKEEIVAYGKPVQAQVIKSATGKPIVACVRQIKEEGAKFPDYNEIEAYARPDGTNSKGEDLLANFKAKIEKNPILIRQAKEQSGGQTASQATAAKDVSNLL